MSEERLVDEYLRGEGAPEGRAWPLWLDPFARVAGGQALGWGLLVLAGMVALGVFGTVAYDGVVDLHVGGQAPVWLLAVMPVLDWLIVALVFLVAGKLFSRSAQRVVDYFGTTALGRLPYLIAGALMLRPLLGGPMEAFTQTLLAGPPQQMSERMMHAPGLAWVVVASLLLMVLGAWLGLVNYRALTASSGLRFPKALFVFLGAALVAEVLSKVGLFFLARAAGMV